MTQIYCGNNANFNGLIRGTHVIGTNYECFRKGIGKGKNLPYDELFRAPYNPIDRRTFYCGRSNITPPQYFSVGWPAKCLQTGIGIGKSQKAAIGRPFAMNFIRYQLPFFSFFVIFGIIFTILYFRVPKFISKKDKSGEKNRIDWTKFIPYLLVIALILFISLYFFWKYIRTII